MLARAAPHRNGDPPNVGEAASAAILAWPKTSVSSAEAGSLIALYDTLNVYAPQTGELVQHDLVCYMRSIVDDEWPSMARGRDLEQRARSGSATASARNCAPFRGRFRTGVRLRAQRLA